MNNQTDPQNQSQTAQQGGDNQAANPGFEAQGQGALQGQGTETDENRLNAQGGQESGGQHGGEGSISGQAANPDPSIYAGREDPTGGATDPSQSNRPTDVDGGQGEGAGGSAAAGEQRSFAGQQTNNFDDQESLDADLGGKGDQAGQSQQNSQDR